MSDNLSQSFPKDYPLKPKTIIIAFNPVPSSGLTALRLERAASFTATPLNAAAKSMVLPVGSNVS